MAMTDEQIQRIQDEIMSSINAETDIEDLIKETAREVGSRLAFSDKVHVEFMDVVYLFKYKKTILPGAKQGIFMFIANMENYRKFKDKYKPYTATVEIDNKFTMRENLQSVIEVFFRHITGRTQAEILE